MFIYLHEIWELSRSSLLPGRKMFLTLLSPFFPERIVPFLAVIRTAKAIKRFTASRSYEDGNE